MTAALLTPFDIGPVTLKNRIVVAPMCQYSADDGSANDWHHQHLMTLAMSGAGLVVVEATAVERRGRITHGCLGLYSDDNEAALKRVIDAAKRVAPPGTKFGIQIGHAGRKASTARPWEGDHGLKPGEDPWPTVAASAMPLTPDRPAPEALDDAGIARTITAFVQAVERAARIGFDVVELHCAHGYLINSFLSPLSNVREDGYGGSFDNRTRFLREVVSAVRAALPERIPLGARISATDWTPGGLDGDDAVAIAKVLKQEGVVYVCASTGGINPTAKVPAAPLFQVPFAERIRKEAGVASRAVGMITTPAEAEAIVADGRADFVALARGFLADPRWGLRATAALGGQPHLPPQYLRAARLLSPHG